LEKLVNDKKANFVIRMKDGKQTIISLAYALKSSGTELQHGDVIIKPSFEITYDEGGNIIIPVVKRELDKVPNFFIYDCRYNIILKQGDRIVRKGKLLENIKYTTSRYFKLQVGDTVERHLRDGDVVLLNRQPTLHRGGMLAMKVVLRPYQTFRFNLAGTKTFNADYDSKRGFTSS
jgi:DNA-directed RNA polymerase beta' subunit